MSVTPDRELQRWTEAWQDDRAPLAAPEAIRRHVRRRSRCLAFWVSGELAIGFVFTTLLVRRVVTESDPWEKVAMSLLAVIALGATGLSWWNWHGTLRASAQTTAAFVALSRTRVHRLRRAVRAGWRVLLAEVAVLIPWIAHRLYGGGAHASVGQASFSWGLLALLTLLGVVLLTALGRSARREATAIEALEADLRD